MDNAQIMRMIEAGLTRDDLVALGILPAQAPAQAPAPAPAPAPAQAPAPASDTGLVQILSQMQQTLADMAQRNVYAGQMMKPMDSGAAIANFINPPSNE